MAPHVQRAIGLTLGTAVGGVIYGIFLQALLFQSLLFDRRPLDPAQWREHLSARAWICGLTLFAGLVFTPLRFLVRTAGATVLTDPTEGGVAWFLIAAIFLIQIATVRYATMRPELCMIEKSSSYSLRHWKNWIQLAIIGIEFFQLFSMSASSSLPTVAPLMDVTQQVKTAVWQLGLHPGAAAAGYDTTFGLLCGFSGLYILLCGIFIAFDLTVDSALSPLLFTLLAGGFYGTITSGLLLIIFYSLSSTQVVVCLLMLAYYSSTAVFVSIYRSDVKKVAPGEIQLMPVFTAIERVSKGILAAVSAATNRSAGSATTLALCLFLITLLARLRPYSASGITMLRIGSIGIAGWTAFVTLLAGSTTSTTVSIPLTVLLFSGWILIPLTIGVLTYKKRSPPPITTREELTVVIESPVYTRTPLSIQPSAPTPSPESSAAAQSAAP
jgi:hypothetical protein